MSRIGRLVLALTESAEAFGFSTIEEAIAAGYEVVYTADPRNAHLVKPTTNKVKELKNGKN